MLLKAKALKKEIDNNSEKSNDLDIIISECKKISDDTLSIFPETILNVLKKYIDV